MPELTGSFAGRTSAGGLSSGGQVCFLFHLEDTHNPVFTGECFFQVLQFKALVLSMEATLGVKKRA